jgi:plastocyanin
MRKLAIIAVCLFASAVSGHTQRAAGAGGTLKGRVRLTGKPPGNVVIRMGMDPACSRIYAGKRPVDAAVLTSDDGGLANVFVQLEGQFPQSRVPSEPVIVDQKGCFYVPRVVGARVGQVLRVTNSDNLLHNVHSMSTSTNGFNVGQPTAGVHHDFKLTAPEMLKLTCDVHRWMISYVGVVNHPYFAVTGAEGSFEIHNVPAGRRTVRLWHEKLGERSQTVDIRSGATAVVTWNY